MSRKRYSTSSSGLRLNSASVVAPENTLLPARSISRRIAVEVGNGFPRDGTDGEWKIAGRDAILTMKDNIVKLAAAKGDEILPGSDTTTPYFTTVRDALDHWQQGKAPPIGVQDCLRAVRLIDQAYARASAPA